MLAVVQCYDGEPLLASLPVECPGIQQWLRQGVPRGNLGFEQGPGIRRSFREVLGPFGNFTDVSGLPRRYERVRGGRLGI